MEDKVPYGNFGLILMHLILFSGFLGSGKTTLVIKLAQFAVEQGKKIAILVNEIGEVGIDNQLMRRLGT